MTTVREDAGRVAVIDDDALAKSAKSGDRSAFAEIVYRFAPRVFRFLRARGLTDADAEDATQDAFLAAYESLKNYDPSRAFAAWLFAIARNKAASMARRTRTTAPLDVAADIAATDPAPSLNDGESGIWRLAKEKLNAREFDALYLKYADGLTVDALADSLGVSAINARQILHRARRILADAFGDKEAIQ